MPVLNRSSYTAPFWLRNGHLQTLWPVLFRKPDLPVLWRERLETPDDDFIDIDYMPASVGLQSNRVVILSHGLEGHSRRRYMLGMAQALNEHGWDVVSRNFRGCSGEPNRSLRLYHSGEIDDLHLVVRRCLELGYTSIALVGFSMGGNQTLKYLGEKQNLPSEIKAAVGISVPCDLEGSAYQLSRPSRLPYMLYFMPTLREKIRIKHQKFPGKLDITGLDRITTFSEFDNRFTAPLHGFSSAQHYWHTSGCLQKLQHIHTPTLLINASDDPFLSASCYPTHVAAKNKALTLEMPRWGGHVGFVTPGNVLYWTEKRTAAYLDHVCGSPAERIH